jgi:hypothetical protein
MVSQTRRGVARFPRFISALLDSRRADQHSAQSLCGARD